MADQVREPKGKPTAGEMLFVWAKIESLSVALASMGSIHAPEWTHVNQAAFREIKSLIRLAPLYEALEKAAEHIVVLRHGGGKWPSVGRESLQQIYDVLAALDAARKERS